MEIKSKFTLIIYSFKYTCILLDYYIFIFILFQVENECGEIPTVLVQNKIDLVDQCQIDP